MKKLFAVLALLFAGCISSHAQSLPVNGCNQVTPISGTASARLIVGVGAKKIIICNIDLVVSIADNVALVEGTGSTCGTGTAGMAGGATAATGWNLPANGILVIGNGRGPLFLTATAGDDVCILVSSGAQVSGSISWAWAL